MNNCDKDPQEENVKHWYALARDFVLTVAALIGIIHQEVSGVESPTLLVVYSAMLGLPLFLRADEQRRRK